HAHAVPDLLVAIESDIEVLQRPVHIVEPGERHTDTEVGHGEQRVILDRFRQLKSLHRRLHAVLGATYKSVLAGKPVDGDHLHPRIGRCPLACFQRINRQAAQPGKEGINRLCIMLADSTDSDKKHE
ncbi:MAG TPA: hypothetical protein PKY96_18345, partial [Flavobacteriales bacterium]|nr:hypothetical protein [Flavobacteriales bacterium]